MITTLIDVISSTRKHSILKLSADGDTVKNSHKILIRPILAS